MLLETVKFHSFQLFLNLESNLFALTVYYKVLFCILFFWIVLNGIIPSPNVKCETVKISMSVIFPLTKISFVIWAVQYSTYDCCYNACSKWYCNAHHESAILFKKSFFFEKLFIFLRVWILKITQIHQPPILKIKVYWYTAMWPY